MCFTRSQAPTAGSDTFPLVLVCRLYRLGHAGNDEMLPFIRQEPLKSFKIF
jgi:hypothetical protein